MRGRVPDSWKAMVHSFEADGSLLRSRCGGIDALPRAVEPTDDPVSCLGCRASGFEVEEEPGLIDVGGGKVIPLSEWKR